MIEDSSWTGIAESTAVFLNKLGLDTGVHHCVIQLRVGHLFYSLDSLFNLRDLLVNKNLFLAVANSVSENDNPSGIVSTACLCKCFEGVGKHGLKLVSSCVLVGYCAPGEETIEFSVDRSSDCKNIFTTLSFGAAQTYNHARFVRKRHITDCPWNTAHLGVDLNQNFVYN